MSTPKVALVYDRVNKYGGAERVLEVLHRLYPDAPIYTSVYNPKTAPWADGWDIRTSFLQHIPFLRTRHELLAWLMPIAFESFTFDEFDMVISVTSEAAKGIITKPKTRHICYLLTPTRYLWSMWDEYYAQFCNGAFTFIFTPLYRFALRYLRGWDKVAAHRPDIIVPISQAVAARSEKYYGREVALPIYPPVETTLFAQKAADQPPFPAPYFLAVSRLVAYKRIDLAVAACMQRRKHLVIVGEGSEEDALRQLAGNSPYIHFLGHLTDAELAKYYHHCTGLLFPGEEDFGISAVEALAAGRPAVVYTHSGNAEVVEDGRTGVVLKHQTVAEMVSAIRRLEAVQWEGSVLTETAKRYNVDIFIRQWRTHVQST